MIQTDEILQYVMVGLAVGSFSIFAIAVFVIDWKHTHGWRVDGV